MVNRRSPTKRQITDTTLKIRLKTDPAIDRLAAAANKRDPLKFMEYRRYLEGFRLVTPREITELDFRSLPRDIRAVAHVDLGLQEADVLFTRNSAFMVFHNLPDFSHLRGMVPKVQFSKKRASLAVSEDEKICIIRVTGPELANILALSTLSMPEKPGEDSRGVPQEQMPIGEKTLQDVDELKGMLREWRVEYVAPGFDFERFISGICVCREFDNGRDSRCFVVALEDDSVHSISYDAPWKRLQMQAAVSGSKEESKPLCWLSDKGRLYMIREEYFV